MENAAQNNDNRENKEIKLAGIDATLVFGANRYFAFIYNKTEKLVTAIYLITDFIKDSEPLKGKIRDNALALMELNLDWAVVSLAERKDLIREYQTVALGIVSLASIARHAGLISDMNYQVLSREFSSLVSFMEEGGRKEANEQTVVLDPAFFAVSEPEPLRPGAFDHAPASVPPHEARGERRPHAPQVAPHKGHEYFPIKDIQARAEKPKKTVESKDDRRTTILKLLSKKSGLNVRDFAEAITGVSEKTIQRELIAMVAAGIIKKEGERRWSTYSLA